MATTEQLLNIGAIFAGAVERERPVLITYRAADGERSTRTVEPYGLDLTRGGHLLVRAMDRRSGEPRRFRLDRIELASPLDGTYELDRPVVMPEIFVRYHGSRPAHHGVVRLLGICGCPRCARLGVRYRLAEVGSHVANVWCVRATSITAMTTAESAAYRAERIAALLDEYADAWQDNALERVRVQAEAVNPHDHVQDAARWTPDCPVYP